VKLPDVNLFLYAYDSHSIRHEPASAWLEQTLSGTETVGLAWIVLLAFIRLSTRSVVVEEPLAVETAIELVQSWLDQPCVTVVSPTERHPAVLRELLAPLGTAGNLTTDAHLAALAIEHGAQLCSSDTDFARFGGLRWKDPLSPKQPRSLKPKAH
jgi:toxin-antitoxin system PIN domain toxin